jgi:uracil-DNA glycosylase
MFSQVKDIPKLFMKGTKSNIEGFLSLLKQSPHLKNVFNPWRDVDRENDRDSGAPEIRTNQLRHYLLARGKKARFLLVGEAIGYQGGHFSGIPMTSERILLGHKEEEGIFPRHVLPNLTPERTSRPGIMPRGFSEPTATIVWGTLLRLSIDPLDFVLWNVFPWHPFHPGKGILSNRMPTVEELKYGYPIVKYFLEMFPGRRIIALGKISSGTFRALGISCDEVRHPANAGAKDFRTKISLLVGNTARGLKTGLLS